MTILWVFVLNVIFRCETGAGSRREQLQSEGPAGGSGGKDAGEEVWPSTAHTGTGDTWRVSRNNMLFPPGMMVSLLLSVLVSVTSSFLTESDLLTFLTCLPLLPQELVSIGTEGRAGDMSVLGNVKHKMVCSPDFEALLESCSWCSSERWRPEHPQVWQVDALVVVTFTLTMDCPWNLTCYTRTMACRLAVMTYWNTLSMKYKFTFFLWNRHVNWVRVQRLNAVPKFKCCWNYLTRLYMDVNVWIKKFLLFQYVGVRCFWVLRNLPGGAVHLAVIRFLPPPKCSGDEKRSVFQPLHLKNWTTCY